MVGNVAEIAGTTIAGMTIAGSTISGTTIAGTSGVTTTATAALSAVALTVMTTAAGLAGIMSGANAALQAGANVAPTVVRLGTAAHLATGVDPPSTEEFKTEKMNGDGREVVEIARDVLQFLSQGSVLNPAVASSFCLLRTVSKDAGLYAFCV